MSCQISKNFRRPLPLGREYRDRLDLELRLIGSKGFGDSFVKVREILDLADGFRHITRGSAGCSLVAYLLGLHDMDPVAKGFALSRFMHERRDDLPDIDVDFAHNQRDEVLGRVMSRYPGRVARISNHVRHRSGSAIRQALRQLGFHGFVPRGFNLEEIAGDRAEEVLSLSRQIEGSFRNFSLHCGGIVIFPREVPHDLRLTDTQIRLDKNEVERNGLFKIDLLCNRGISQLNELSSRPLSDYPETDDATAALLRSGDTWGVTFAESPAQRRLHRDLLPSSRSDVTLSLALIRPLPSADGRRREILDSLRRCGSLGENVVYDDDGIRLVQRTLGCSESEAEIYRKAFAKRNEAKISEFVSRMNGRPETADVVRQLNYFRLYSFCHAHATSYGMLVWALAYEKARQPKRFWWSALNHAQSMYRPWVHVQQAKLAGLRFRGFGRGPWRLDGDDLWPERTEGGGDGWSQHSRRGYWTSDRFMPGMYAKFSRGRCEFRGLVATGRHHVVDGREITFVTLGVNTGVFLDLVLEGLHDFERAEVVDGSGHVAGGSVRCDRFALSRARPAERTLFSQ